MMTFGTYDSSEWRETSNSFEYVSSKPTIKTPTDSVKLFADKMCVPQNSAVINRPRLIAHLEKSLEQFSATLVTGRAGTGKTTLAADFARQTSYDVAWYKAETSDSDWKVLLSYFAESLRQSSLDCQPSKIFSLEQNDKTEGLSVTESLAAQFATIENEKPLLIVIDDLHSVFDAEWFPEFFNALLSLRTQNVQLLLLARTAPPFPLWRLRSKQILGMMDEKLLAFNPEETIELFAQYGLDAKAALAANKLAYGRICKLKQIAEERCVKEKLLQRH